MRNKKGAVLITAGVLLILAAIGFAAYNVLDSNRADRAAEEAAEIITETLPERTVELDEGDLPDYVLNPDMAMPTVELDGYEYIGTLDIPALELTLPVMSDWSYPKLKVSPCRFSGSAYSGGLIIAAHNYNRHFGGIKNLRTGDAVTFTDAVGNVFSYTVAAVEQLAGNQLTELESGSWALTLFTCTVGGQSRVVIRCDEANE